MKRLPWELKFGLSLVLLSVFLYLMHYVFFKDARHILLWTTTSIAFLPISVLFVTLIINRLLMRREMHLVMDKLNMLIGTFFSVVGTSLIRHCAEWDPRVLEIRREVNEGLDCSEREYRRVRQRLLDHAYAVDVEEVDLDGLHEFLAARSDFLLRLMENPHLLEHTTFTDLLRAVFHLSEELASRGDLEQLPDSDRQHLAADIERAYRLIVPEWMNYMRYLEASYPFLFSFAIRTNPFEKEPRVVVE